MGLLYTAAFDNVTFTDAAQDILFLQAGTAPVKIHQVRLTSSVTTDVRARIGIVRRSTAGSGGTGITPRAKFERNSVSALTTVTYARTTVGTIGNALAYDHWSLLVPWQVLDTPELRIDIAPSGFLGINLVAATGATRVISGVIEFEEA